MRLQHVAGGDDAFFESQRGVAQVFVGFLQVLVGHGQFLGGFVHLEGGLADLQFNLFARVLQLVLGDARLGFGGFHLVDAFAPVPDGQGEGDAHVPHAFEFLLEAVEHRGVGGHVSAYQGERGQVVGARHVDLLPVDVGGKLQAAYLRAAGVDGVQVDGACRRGRGAEVVFRLVGQADGGGEVQPAQLAEQHPRQVQPVVHLGQRQGGFVCLHLDGEGVRAGGHAFGHHLVHVAFQLLEQPEVAFGQFLFMRQRHHLPVGLVGAEDDVLRPCPVLLAGQFFGIAGDFVVGADFAAHVERLGQGQGAGIHVARVGAQRVHQGASRVVQRAGQALPQGGQRAAQFGVDLGDGLRGLLQGRPQAGAQAGEGALLRVAQQGQFAAGAHVAPGGGQLGQEVGEGRLLLVAGSPDPFAAHLQFLVVGDGQGAATVQAEHALRRAGQQGAGQGDDTKNLFHCSYCIHFLDAINKDAGDLFTKKLYFRS